MPSITFSKNRPDVNVPENRTEVNVLENNPDVAVPENRSQVTISEDKFSLELRANLNDRDNIACPTKALSEAIGASRSDEHLNSMKNTETVCKDKSVDDVECKSKIKSEIKVEELDVKEEVKPLSQYFCSKVESNLDMKIELKHNSEMSLFSFDEIQDLPSARTEGTLTSAQTSSLSLDASVVKQTVFIGNTPCLGTIETKLQAATRTRDNKDTPPAILREIDCSYLKRENSSNSKEVAEIYGKENGNLIPETESNVEVSNESNEVSSAKTLASSKYTDADALSSLQPSSDLTATVTKNLTPMRRSSRIPKPKKFY